MSRYAENVFIGHTDALFSKTVDQNCSKHAPQKQPQTQYWFEAWLTLVTLLSREGTLKKTYSVKDPPPRARVVDGSQKNKKSM